jgi:hypothetical protein
MFFLFYTFFSDKDKMTFVLILWMKKIIREKFSFSRRENVNNKTIRNIHFMYIVMKICVPIPFQDDSPDRINFYQTKRKSKFLNISLWLACIVSFTCIKPFSLLLILIRVVFLFHIPMSYETINNKIY